MSFEFRCPVCGNPLHRLEKTMKCDNNHSFDIASQGYVNLLQSQKSSKKRHGDDRLMVKARSDFLDKGYYYPLLKAIIEEIDLHTKSEMTIADLGCGECWYTSQIVNHLKDNGIKCDACGIDISKYALIAGLKRCHEMNLSVGSISDLPIQSESCDIALSIFAPYNEKEIERILKDEGLWIKVIPLEEHLMGLKAVVYENPYKNEVDRTIPDGFSLLSKREVMYNIEINNNTDIMNLFKMTPYYYKTGEEDQHKIEQLNSLVSIAQFEIDIFIKNAS